MKTLLEFKNEVAVGYGCESWRDMFMEFRKQEMNINPYFNDAAEKYANQFKEENERLRALFVKVNDLQCHANTFESTSDAYAFLMEQLNQVRSRRDN